MTSRRSAVSWVVNALVDATPISAPAWVMSTRSAARTSELSGELQMVRQGPNPCCRATSSAARVSMVSPDWDRVTTSQSSGGACMRDRNSLAISVRHGTP